MARKPDSQLELPIVKNEANKASIELQNQILSFFDNFLLYQKGLRALRAKSFEALSYLELGTVGGFRKQIKAPAGLGKTTAVIDNLSRCKGNVIWFLTPNHKLAEEVYQLLQQRANVEPHFIKGRSKDNCDLSDHAQKIGSQGLPVQSTLCEECVFKETCGYQELKRQIESLPELKADDPPRVFVMTHNYLVLPSIAPKPHLVIIDESHWNMFCESFTLNISELSAFANKEKEHYSAYSDIVDLLNQVAKNGLDKTLKELDLSAAKMHLEKQLRELISAVKNDPLNHSETPKIRKIQLIIIFIKQLEHEISLKRSNPESIIFNLDTIKVHHLKAPVIKGNVPMLLIDASADLEINRHIWGKGLKEAEIKVERNAYVIQVSKSFSKYSLGGSKDLTALNEDQEQTRERVISYINNMAGSSQKPIFLAAPKGILDSIGSELSPNIEKVSFNNLRGQDKFKNLEVGIILSREQPQASDIESLARCLRSRTAERGLLYGRYTKTPSYYLMQDNSKLEAKDTWYHPDGLSNRILRQIREEELEQAIDRLRLVHNTEAKLIIILCNVPLNITLNRLWSFKELLEGGSRLELALKQAFKYDRAFPLGYTEWAILFQELFTSKDAAKSYYDNMGGLKRVKTQLIYLLGNDPFIEVKYWRNKGQRKPCIGIVCARSPDIKQALESVVGPIIKVELIGPFLIE